MLPVSTCRNHLKVFLLQCSHLSLLQGQGHWTFFFFPTKFFTFGRWLHGDLVAEVTSACSGHSCSPDQVLLPVVEVGDSVEEKLWVGFILAGHLRRHRSRVQGQLSYLTLLYFLNSAAAFYQSLRNTGNQFVVGSIY